MWPIDQLYIELGSQAEQLTLSRPAGVDYAHPSTMSPPHHIFGSCDGPAKGRGGAQQEH